MIKAATVTVAAAVGLSLAAAHGRAETSSPRVATLAFVRIPPADASAGVLSFVRADGTGMRESGLRVDGLPVWSPDGRRLAYSFRGNGKARLYVTDPNGAARRAVTRRQGWACYWLSWSPDSRRIAYTVNFDCGGWMSIRIVDATGRGDRGLIRGEGHWDPVWSRDGREIAYGSYVGQTVRLFVARTDGGRRHPVGSAHPLAPSGLPQRPTVVWSADGRSIYYLGGDRALHSIDADGSHDRTLTTGLSVLGFDLSPDGRSLAFSAVATPGTRDVYVVATSGADLRQLTTGKGVLNEDPRWSPDGAAIAYTRRQHWGDQADIYLANADGRDPHPLVVSPLDDVAPAWRPAG